MIKKMLIGLLIVVALGVAGVFGWYMFNRTTDYDGYWVSDDVGFYLEIKGGIVRSYQYEDGEIIRFPVFDGLIRDHALKCYLSYFEIYGQDEILNIKEVAGGTVYNFNPLDDVLSVKKDLADDPYYNFEVFYKSFKNHYAYFDLYGVDWQAQYDKYSNQVNADMTENELNEIYKQMVAELNDDHITLDWIGDGWSPYTDGPDWHNTENSRGFVGVISDNYIQGELTYLTGRGIRYGRIKDNLGYINIATMAIEDNMKDSYDTMSKDIEEAIGALVDTDAIILDLRFNEGGYDSFSRSIAGYFTQDRYLAYTRQSTNINGEGYTFEKYVEPNQNMYYSGKVYVLTSSLTVSAAETFALCMDELENVTFVGEQTAGYYSDALPRVLPNGGTYSLSFETFYKTDGTVPEGTSVEIDEVIPLDTGNIEKSIDPALDWIIGDY